MQCHSCWCAYKEAVVHYVYYKWQQSLWAYLSQQGKCRHWAVELLESSPSIVHVVGIPENLPLCVTVIQGSRVRPRAGSLLPGVDGLGAAR